MELHVIKLQRLCCQGNPWASRVEARMPGQRLSLKCIEARMPGQCLRLKNKHRYDDQIKMITLLLNGKVHLLFIKRMIGVTPYCIS